ncbi:MAG: HAD-IB family hydrolase [Anaerolineales bacterium]
MKRVAALFDCDGTLFAAQYGRGLMKYSSANGRRGIARAYYVSLVLPYLLNKYLLLGDEPFNRTVTSRLAWMVKGLTEKEFDSTSEWILQEHALPTERSEVVVRLRDHQAKGHVILLVSGWLTPSLILLGAHYKADGVVGTKLEMKDGRYTGRIIPPVITGVDKDLYAREFFTNNNLEIDWESSYAYADSMTDTELFEMVGNPVAVYPDEKLQNLATFRDWEIIGKAMKTHRNQ